MNEIEAVKFVVELGMTGILLALFNRIYTDREALAARYLAFLEKQNERLLSESASPVLGGRTPTNLG